MTPRSNVQTILALVFTDMIALVITYHLAIRFRISMNAFFGQAFDIETSYLLLPPFFLILTIALMSFLLIGLYDHTKTHNNLELIGRIVSGAMLAITLLIAVSFFFSRNLYSRSLMGFLLATAILVVGVARLLTKWALAHARSRGLAVSKVAIIGNGSGAARLAERLDFPGSQLKVEGTIRTSGHVVAGSEERRVLGPLEHLENVINEHQLRQIVLSDEDFSDVDIATIASVCEKMDVRLDKTAGLFAATPKQVSVINGIPLLNLVSLGESRWDHVIKRSMDIALSVFLILLLSPLLLIIPLAIRLDSKGPVMFLQRRRGRGGRYFTMLKFRSMKTDAEQDRELLGELNEKDGALFKMRQDPRVTRVGRILRRFSLDELPQLVNVLLGEMSFVGPRPLPVEDIESNLEDPRLSYWIEERENVTPGITGLWQVRGRSNLSFKEMAVLDVLYVKSWSLFMDFQILAKTIPVVLLGKGAY